MKFSPKESNSFTFPSQLVWITVLPFFPLWNLLATVCLGCQKLLTCKVMFLSVVAWAGALIIWFSFQIAVYGKNFNHSARDAWELFQSTGIEALVAYDCSGAVLFMGTVLGGLITGTCTGVWTWLRTSDRVVMVGFTSMLMGMILVCYILFG